MLDLEFIRTNPETVRNAITQKGVVLDLDALLALEKQTREQIGHVETLRRQRREMADAFRNHDTPPARETAAAQARAHTATLAREEQNLKELQENLQRMLYLVPNIPVPTAPVGPDDTHNIVIETHGNKPDFAFPPRDHVDLLEHNDWADLPRIAKVMGTRAYLLKGELALLEMALWNFTLTRMHADGFTPLNAPALAREFAFYGTGHFPAGQEDIYRLEGEDLYLTGTVEVIINALHKDEILEEDQLPLRYAGFSTCFRREVGNAGKDVRGLLRVHQFYKVEQFVLCKNDMEESAYWHAHLLENAKSFLSALELPFQVVECCTGDMGAGKYRMNDIETWLPSGNKYRETHSCSTLTDWQARRTNLRYRTKTGGIKYVHTLNNTALATPRILAQFLENHQQQDGSVYIPPALRPFLGGREKIGGKEKE